MVIAFRLPTFHEDLVVPFLYDPVTELWAEQAPIDGQFYYGRRSQPGTAWPSIWVVYRKEDDVLRDPAVFDYDPYHGEVWPGPMDAVAIIQPTGAAEPTLYWVVQVDPRWLGFGNEHRCAYLRRATASEAAAILSQPPPPPAEMPLSFEPPVDDSCTECESFVGPFALELQPPPAPGVELWRLEVPFDCAAFPDTTVLLGLSYFRETGALTVTLNDAAGTSTLVIWSSTVVDWDYTTPEVAFLEDAVTDWCTWPSALITPD